MLEATNNLSYAEGDRRTSKMGYDFDLTDSAWKLDTSVKLNWALLPDNVACDFLEGFKQQMADYASELSASTCYIIFREVLTMLRATNGDNIKLTTVQNYLSTLETNQEWKLGSIRAFLLNWFDKDIGGFDPKVATWLEQLTLKGVVKGIPVAKGCPHSGAYSRQEQQAILFWGVNAFFDDKLSLRDYTWLLLNVYLGARPTQFCQLKACDLAVKKNNGRTEYSLNIPQAKKRGSTNFREVMKGSSIDEDLALLISNQAKETLKQIEDKVGELPENLKGMMPVFGFSKAIAGLSSIEQLLMFTEKTPDSIHMPRKSGSQVLNKLSKKCIAKSERLKGEFIHLTARRFRYTIGTNAASRGLSAFSIAKILGHSDIQNVKVYTENVKELTEEVNEALAPVLAPLAQAFAGTLIESEVDAIRANDPRSRIKTRKSGGVGNCGSYGFCAKGGRACYTCVKFQPWVHGRHQVILDDLMGERNRLKEKGASEFVIQSTDRLVLAITEVVQVCEERIKSGSAVNG